MLDMRKPTSLIVLVVFIAIAGFACSRVSKFDKALIPELKKNVGACQDQSQKSQVICRGLLWLLEHPADIEAPQGFPVSVSPEVTPVGRLHQQTFHGTVDLQLDRDALPFVLQIRREESHRGQGPCQYFGGDRVGAVPAGQLSRRPGNIDEKKAKAIFVGNSSFYEIHGFFHGPLMQSSVHSRGASDNRQTSLPCTSFRISARLRKTHTAIPTNSERGATSNC